MNHALIRMYTQKWKDPLSLDHTAMATLQNMSDSCGFTNFSANFVTYPPTGPIPLPTQSFTGIPNARNISRSCRTWDTLFDLASRSALMLPLTGKPLNHTFIV